MKNRRLLFLIAIQIVLWVGFIALPYFMVPRQMELSAVDAAVKHTPLQATDMAQHVFLGSLAFNICLILFFYLHHYILFDRLIVRKRFAAYFSIVIACFAISFFASYLTKECVLPKDPIPYHPLTLREIVKTTTWFMLVLLISLGFKLLSQWRQAEQRAREIENEQLRTELSFLHAQINPHFLFNSLNTVYSLSLTKTDAAPLAILKLSELLRYVIDESKHERVPLESEVNYLHNYIELQKLRSASTLAVTFKTEGDIDAASIAPLLLLPFVENAFKYGISNSEPSPIDITLRVTATELEFSVANKKMEGGIKPSTGIGINNVKRRLNIVYPGKHELEINDQPRNYFVKLKIKSI